MSSRSEAVVRLGERLVAELGFSDSVDTLGRWMSHYVAELIVAAEEAGPREKRAREKECSAAILDLWAHKHELPDGTRPFRDAEWLLRSMRSLDPEDETPRYYRGIRAEAEQKMGKGAAKWIRMAEGLDAIAKMLVLECLLSAGRESVAKTAPWIALADAARAKEDAATKTLKMLLREAKLGGAHPTAGQRAAIRKRLKLLAGFEKVARILTVAMQKQLAESGSGQKPRKKQTQRKR